MGKEISRRVKYLRSKNSFSEILTFPDLPSISNPRYLFLSYHFSFLNHP